MRFRPALFALLLLLAIPTVVSGEGASALRDDYQRLQQWRYATVPVAVPPEGFRWTFEGATWELESGRLWYAEPTAQGKETGLVFEGKGKFHLAARRRRVEQNKTGFHGECLLPVD